MKKKNGEWTIIESEERFSNDFFKVVEDKVIRPDGKPDKYATINFPPGTSVLPLDEHGNVYLTRQFRYALGRKDLEVVSGAVEDSEESLEAAKRETLEELGIEAGKWTEMGRVEANTSITNSAAHLFLATHLTFREPDREPSEEIETVKISLADVYKKVMNGEITHDQTIVLVLKTYIESKKGR